MRATIDGTRMLTYRDEIRLLDSLATPAPWASDGELYGVRVDGSFTPLGFAPHRPLDSRLIVVYRSAVVHLVDAMDAVERLVARACEDEAAPAAIGIAQILTILDATEGEPVPVRETLAELDRATTPPPWDPGHLVLGMELDAETRASLGIATPRAGDSQLIAVTRAAVPRALECLALAEAIVTEHGRRDGSLRREGAVAIADLVTAFDQHRASEGSGTGTV
ncbi:MAG: hypothetical protein WCB51_12160 [Candidatus Dormiibacterota bacterium]